MNSVSLGCISGFAATLVLAASASCAGEPGPETAAEPAKNLLQNGDFEKADASGKHPLGWDRPDGLTTFWAEENAGAGGKRCLKLDTDVLESEWKDRQEQMKKDDPGPAKPKTPVLESQQYATVGGNHGVSVYSHAIPVKQGQAYKLALDIKGPRSTDLFFPKMFVKGFADVRGEMRVSYRMYLACRITEDGWMHFERTFSPTKKTSTVNEMKVMLYCYWPRGTYWVDNIALTEVADVKPEDDKPQSMSNVEGPALDKEKKGPKKQ